MRFTFFGFNKEINEGLSVLCEQHVKAKKVIMHSTKLEMELFY